MWDWVKMKCSVCFHRNISSSTTVWLIYVFLKEFYGTEENISSTHNIHLIYCRISALYNFTFSVNKNMHSIFCRYLHPKTSLILLYFTHLILSFYLPLTSLMSCNNSFNTSRNKILITHWLSAILTFDLHPVVEAVCRKHTRRSLNLKSHSGKEGN